MTDADDVGEELDAHRSKALRVERSSPVSIDYAFREPVDAQRLAMLPMCTLSLMFVQTLLYPLDTVKRCLQVNGAVGHKDLYSGTLDCLGKLYKEGGVRMLYQGLTANLLRCAPVTIIQFLVFQATKGLVE